MNQEPAERYSLQHQRQGWQSLGSALPALDAETARLRSWLDRTRPERWQAPTRCENWTVHDVVAHLSSGELYNQACLDDNLAALGTWDDDEAYNIAHVDRRRHIPEWVWRHSRVHAAWRAMDAQTLISTGTGPYMVGMQAWHIASEYATHSDDIGVPVPGEEQPDRLAWRYAFSRYAVRERALPLEVLSTGSIGELSARVSVSSGGVTLSLPPEDFVAAVSARLALPDAMPHASSQDTAEVGTLLAFLRVLVTT